jgi:hypothetical protein
MTAESILFWVALVAILAVWAVGLLCFVDAWDWWFKEDGDGE